jgi:hypothetical protein
MATLYLDFTKQKDETDKDNLIIQKANTYIQTN